MTDQELHALRQDLRGDTPLTSCNKEAGSFSELWGRDCWVADSVLSLIQCSIEEEMDSSNLQDPLFKVYKYCGELREKNRLGTFSDVIAV